MRAVQNIIAIIVIVPISFVPVVDYDVYDFILNLRGKDFPDVVRLPTAFGHEIAVEIGVVDDVPGAVDGCFESHHEVEFLVPAMS